TSFDVITILNVINELEKEDLEDLLLNFDTLLADDGVLIILEPALKFSTRKLMDFRNKILEKYQYKISYPCFHDKECPMLSCKNDWCHGELQGLDSRLVNMLDGITGFNKHKIKYSCAVFYKNKKEKFVSYEDYARVVSVPKLSNRGLSFTACALDCYKEILISKDELKKNKDLKKLRLLDKFNIKEKFQLYLK
ncbi:MAG: small ribosomal subunit Rsm22 family protein, partial [Bdellovibrionota bacterium]